MWTKTNKTYLFPSDVNRVAKNQWLKLRGQTNDADEGVNALSSTRQYKSWKTLYYSNQRSDRFDSAYYSGLRGYVKELLNKVLLWRAFRCVVPGQKVVEVACGSGRLAKFLVSNGRQVIAVDISKSMLQKTRSHCDPSGVNYNGSLSLIQGEVEKLPLQSGSCSGVVSFRLMQAASSCHRISFLKEMRRICEGPLFIQYQSGFAFKHFVRWLRRKKTRINRVDKNILNCEAERAGLSIHRIIRKFWLFSEDVLVIFI